MPWGKVKENYLLWRIVATSMYCSTSFCYRASTLTEYYKSKKNIDNLRAAYQNYQLAFKLIRRIEKAVFVRKCQVKYLPRIPNESLMLPSKMPFYCTKKPSQRKCLASIFDYLEQSKALVLQAAMKEADAKLKGKIPQHLLKTEHNLRKQLLELDKQITQEKLRQNELDTQRLLQLQAQQLDLNQQFETLIQHLENEFPNYCRWKYHTSKSSIEQVQLKLEEGELFLEYFEGKSFLFVLAIGKQKIKVRQLKKEVDFAKNIDQLNEAISLCDEEWLNAKAQELYKLLIAPILEEKEAASIHKLVIIPDGNLFRLPFDVLQDVNTTKSLYLIEKYEITYHYAASLWIESHLNKGKAASFLGVAPVQFNYSAMEKTQAFISKSIHKITENEIVLPSLWDSEKEVRAIHSLFEAENLHSQLLLYKNANPSNLKKHLKGKKYILLSTHGFVNTQNPSLSGIYLANEEENTNTHPFKVYTSDTYLLQLEADLVCVEQL